MSIPAWKRLSRGPNGAVRVPCSGQESEIGTAGRVRWSAASVAGPAPRRRGGGRGAAVPTRQAPGPPYGAVRRLRRASCEKGAAGAARRDAAAPGVFLVLREIDRLRVPVTEVRVGAELAHVRPDG